MPLQAESEALHLIDSLTGLLIARNRNDMSAWYTGNVAGSLALEVQRAQAALVKVTQLLLEAPQWYAGDDAAIVRVQGVKDRLESLIASAVQES